MDAMAQRYSPMTRMSDHGGVAAPDLHASYAESLRRSPVARPVHRCPTTVVLALPSLLMLACVIPPSLSVDNQDAGVNSPPAITAVRSDQVDLPEPGPVLFSRGTGTLNLDLLDTDVDDKLYVRVFVDYTVADPTAPRAQCTAPISGNAKRSLTCDLGALCLLADVNQERFMSVVVFDREPLEAGKPAFQALPDGGLSTSRFFVLKCQESS